MHADAVRAGGIEAFHEIHRQAFEVRWAIDRANKFCERLIWLLGIDLAEHFADFAPKIVNLQGTIGRELRLFVRNFVSAQPSVANQLP